MEVQLILTYEVDEDDLAEMRRQRTIFNDIFFVQEWDELRTDSWLNAGEFTDDNSTPQETT